MKKLLGMKTNIWKNRKFSAIMLTIAMISGYLTPLEGVFAADSQYWKTEYYMEVDGGIPIGDEDGIQYLDMKKGESVNFHMILTGKNNAGSERFKETFSITMPDVLYDQAAEALKDGWLESEDTDCGYLLEISDNTDTATDNNATSSNATSSNSSADKNVQEEEGMKKLTFRFVQELRNKKNISIDEAEGMISFTAPVDGRITITQDGNDCRAEVQSVSIKRQSMASGNIGEGNITIVQYESTYSVSTGATVNEYEYTTPYQITGESTENIVTVSSDDTYNGGKEVNIILKEASISNIIDSPFQLGDNTMVKLTISGKNSLICNNYIPGFIGTYAGLYVSPSATITISAETDDVTDILTATGGSFGAGIGGSYKDFYDDTKNVAGNITINSGTIKAKGGESGAGIGGGNDGAVGEINISGGTIEAKGGESGAGIGSGKYGAGGEINISGGTITATKGTHAPNDIGNGDSGRAGTIKITGGSIYPASGADAVSPRPTNGSDDVYLNILTVGNFAVADTVITSASVSDLENDYGITNVKTDGYGKVYFWLPKTGNSGTDSETVLVMVEDGDYYAKTWPRVDNTEEKTLELLAVPDAPGSLYAVPGDQKVELSWITPNNGGSTITKYQYSAVSAGSDNWKDIPDSDASTTSYTVIGLNNGVQYTFKVRAVNIVVNGAAASKTATPQTTASAPVNLTATPGDKQVKLIWTTPDDGGRAIIKYQYSIDEDNWLDIPDSNETTTNYIVSGLINGNQYTIKVRAVNAVGAGEEAVVTVTPQKTVSVPAAPGNLTTVSGINQIELSWTTPDDGGSAIIKYQYSTDGDNWQDIPDSDATTTSYTLTGLSNGTRYTLKIRAVNAVGVGAAATVTASTTSGSSSSGSSSSDSCGQWKLDEKGWWYRYDNGTWPVSGWIYLYYNGFYAWYHFDADGYINTGWFTDTDGNRYYLNPVSDGTKGVMKTGWVLIDGKWYYFNDSATGKKGALLASTTTPDGYQVDENGVWIQIQ